MAKSKMANGFPAHLKFAPALRDHLPFEILFLAYFPAQKEVEVVGR